MPHYFNLLSQLDVCGNFAAAWLPDRWKGTGDNKLIDMAFNKGRADDRKTWMNKYQAPKWTKVDQLEVRDQLEMRATFDHKINVAAKIRRKAPSWTTPNEQCRMRTLCKTEFRHVQKDREALAQLHLIK